jgi:signal peptidase I
MGRRLVPAVFAASVLTVALGGCGGSENTFRIPSEAMAPTYKVGDHVKVDRDVGSPKLGEVVVAYAPAGANTPTCGAPHAENSPCPRSTPARADVRFVKRVVAGPGDRVAFVHGRVVLNGKPQADPHANIRDCAVDVCELPRPATVPQGDYFVVGDNRGNSADSRQWGPVPKGWIYGKVTGKE